MFFDDHKKMINGVVARRHAKTGEMTLNPTEMKNEKVMDEGGEVDGRYLAAQEIIGAHNEKSPEKLMKALANFMDIHGYKMSKQPDSEEPMSEGDQ